jgi:predicted amino acid racemase
MYPRLNIDLKKLAHNTSTLVQQATAEDLSLMGVTKVFCAIPRLAEVLVASGIDYVADSRIQNLIKLEGLKVPKVLLRLPMISEVKEVVKYADISLNSELETIYQLDEAAALQDTVHEILLMIDLGDLREGILPKDIEKVVQKVNALEHISIAGFGVNLTCYGGVIPSEENLGELVTIAKKMDDKYNLNIDLISGGNSSSLYLIDNGLPEGINNLRLGEAIVLGRETAYGESIEGLHDDIFTLEAELIELKTKDSVPTGKIGMDAFGNKPTFKDQGLMLRGILAIGRQDVDFENLTPDDEAIELIGSSSDHLIVNLTKSPHDYAVGDKIQFKVDYGALLKLMTSDYVFKNVIE